MENSHIPELASSAGKVAIVTFVTALLTTNKTSYIGKPYLKAKLIEILYDYSLPYGASRLGVLGDEINYNSLALQYLMPALVQFYIDAEFTGQSSQCVTSFHQCHNTDE